MDGHGGGYKGSQADCEIRDAQALSLPQALTLSLLACCIDASVRTTGECRDNSREPLVSCLSSACVLRVLCVPPVSRPGCPFWASSTYIHIGRLSARIKTPVSSFDMVPFDRSSRKAGCFPGGEPAAGEAKILAVIKSKTHKVSLAMMVQIAMFCTIQGTFGPNDLVLFPTSFPPSNSTDIHPEMGLLEVKAGKAKISVIC